MDDKTRTCFMMSGLILAMILVVGFFQFYVSVKARVNGVHFSYVQE